MQGIVSQYQGMDICTSPRETLKKNMHQNKCMEYINFQLSQCFKENSKGELQLNTVVSYLLIGIAYSWPSCPKCSVHQSPTSIDDLSQVSP